MTTVPKTVKTNFMWDHDATGEDIRVRVVGLNTGRLDYTDTLDCGCERAAYTLDDCGGPADLIVGWCADRGGIFCWGESYVVRGRFSVTPA